MAKPATQSKSSAPKTDEAREMPLVSEQDVVGQAQTARPYIAAGLIRFLGWQAAVFAILTIVVVGVVVREQMAGSRVWASNPDNETYELMVHDSEGAAAAYVAQAAKKSLGAAKPNH